MKEHDHKQIAFKIGCDLGVKPHQKRKSRYSNGTEDVFSQAYAVISNTVANYGLAAKTPAIPAQMKRKHLLIQCISPAINTVN